MAQDYWWLTRPKRKLDTIPEELAAFCSTALGQKWTRNRDVQIAFEEELETTGTKRVGERRDASGSGGRTHASLLYSLGLWFEKNDKAFLTLAGEAIMAGKPPVAVLKKQVLYFQYPSSYSEKVKVTPRFKVRPFLFLLRLLSDSRIKILTQEEIAFIVCINAENEKDRCYEDVVGMILRYREFSYDLSVFGEDYLANHGASANNLMDVANTMMNWLDYTQLVYREKKSIGISSDKQAEVDNILATAAPFIKYPVADDVYQRKYGLDPWHQKDTRNLLNTETVTSRNVDRNRILRAFFTYSSMRPIKEIDSSVVDYISLMSGTESKLAEEVLTKAYPNGAVGGFLSNYWRMAFQGKDEATDFEEATTNLFQDVFGYKASHIGQSGAKSTPDILLISDSDGYQAIVDTKAYSKYSISGDHHNRMVYNYIAKISNYSDCKYPLAYFTYISGGFVSQIDQQIQSVVSEPDTHGSCITVSNFIELIEDHMDHPYSHKELRKLFSMDRQIMLSDIHN